MSSNDYINQANLGADDTKIKFSVHRERELKEMLSHFPHDMRSNFDKWIRILVKEETEGKNQAMQRSNNCVLRRNLELRISNNIPSLWTGDNIECIGGTPVTVTLVDSQTKEEVKSGPEAFGKVEIVVIKAEEAEDGRNEFECKLVSHNGGKKNVYVTKFPLKLLEGTVDLPKVRFAHESVWMKKSNLRLQARFADSFDGVHVNEAQTEPFIVEDFREKGNKKPLIPSLDDDVWRLNNIGKKGPIEGRLINAGIKTVGDFIVHLYLQYECLKEIFNGGKREKAKNFEETVDHARKCEAILTYRCSADQKTEVVFDVLGDVLGLFHGDSYLSRSELHETQKEFAKELVISAFKNWKDVNRFTKDQLDARCNHFLKRNLLHDEQDPYPQFLPKLYDEVYCEYEGLCTSPRLEPEENRSCKRLWRWFWVVRFTIIMPNRSFNDSHARKKQRLS